jgi:uncharacterized protein (DUF58 family)
MAAPFAPEAVPLLAALLGLLALAAALDAALPAPALEALSLRAEPVLRLARGRKGRLSLQLQKAGRTAPLALRLGLELPEGLDGGEPLREAQLGPGPGPHRVDWELMPARRGRWRLGALRVEAPSRLGLWLRRRELPLECEVRVAPSLEHERRSLAHYLLRRGGGVRALRVSGQGREFDKLREYSPGDAFGDIDWKATARKARPVSRVYQVERTQELTVAVDVSRLSARPAAGGRPGDTALEAHLRAALALQLAAAAQGDRFGLVAFGGRLHGQLAPASGAAARHAATELLSRLQPSHESPDYRELAGALGQRRGRRGLLVLLACLDDPLAGEQCLQAAPELTRGHAVLALSSRRSGVEPAFSRPLEPGEDLADALAAQWRYHGLRRLAQGLRVHGAQLAWVKEERLAQQAVSLYVRARERQWV